MRAAQLWIGLCLVACLGTSALAQQTVVYKNDQFDPDIATAATQIAGVSLAVQPGFAQGEGFGSVFRPAASDYPVRILGLDMVLAGPPNLPGTAEANAMIEFWSIGAGPTPGSKLWEVSTADLFDPNSGQTGIPLTGNVAWSVDFDYQDPLNHPPEIQADNFAVIIRYTQPSQDLQTEWGTLQCMSMPGLGFCGCQLVAPILDQASTQQANLMHILTSSDCTGPAGNWSWANSIGVTGDFILRVRAEVAGCSPDCAGRECGDDGCGGSCGDCQPGESCDPGGLCQGCTPSCTDLCCGDDGCGGACPDTCGAGTHCDAGTCGCVPDGGCTDGERRCVGDVVEVCVAGAWQEVIDCSAASQSCLAGACVACVDGERRCSAEVVEVCAAGAWQEVIDCAGSGQLCLAGACVACVGSALRCQGDTVEMCVSNAWQTVIDCAASAQVCVDGACQAVCDPDCAGKECGDDGCGGTCGSCQAGESCDGSGQCVTGCTPDCAGKECGDDGCGDTCGSCQAGESCDGSGQCVTGCTPDCTGKECGDDGCGGSCGGCGAEQTCDAGGRCVACTPDCTGRECGEDGCGGTCGSCQAGESCDASGQCVTGCTPDCAGKECGDDGCGGTCGACATAEVCEDFQCVDEPGSTDDCGCGASGGAGDGLALLGLLLLAWRRGLRA